MAGGGQYDAALAVHIVNCARKCGVFLEGHNNFCMGRNNFGGEGAVCCGEIRDRSAITSCSGGKVGYGVHRFLLVKFLLVKVIGRLEPGSGVSDLRFSPFLVGGCDEGFKVRPCFSRGWQALPGFAVVEEEVILED